LLPGSSTAVSFLHTSQISTYQLHPSLQAFIPAASGSYRLASDDFDIGGAAAIDWVLEASALFLGWQGVFEAQPFSGDPSGADFPFTLASL
jgi:hypothetical protein